MSARIPDGVVIVSGAAGACNLMLVNADGSIVAASPSTDTVTQNVVAVTDASTSLLAANASRIGGTIQNHSSSVLGVKFTNAATFAQAPIKLQQYQTLHLGDGFLYTGAVWGIYDAGLSGNVGVVEG